MKILKLTIKKKWFDLIKSGEKKIEYREYKQYWITRIVDKNYDVIEFKNGYKKNSPKILLEYKGYEIIDMQKTPIGCIRQFAIKLGKII